MVFDLSEEHVLLGLDLVSMTIGLMLIFVILVDVQACLSLRVDLYTC